MHLEVAFFNCLENLLSSRRHAVFSSILKGQDKSQAIESFADCFLHISLIGVFTIFAYLEQLQLADSQYSPTLSSSLVLTLSLIPTLLGVLFLLSLASNIKHEQTAKDNLQNFQTKLLLKAHSPLQ